jgi:N-methylhydantoinase B
LLGGESASPSKYILNPDGDARERPSKVTVTLPEESVISYRTPGGGGYGSPLERDPQAVLADVIAGKVSVDRAHDAYGVAVNQDGCERR